MAEAEEYDWVANADAGWIDEYPGLRQLFDEKAAAQQARRDAQQKEQHDGTEG